MLFVFWTMTQAQATVTVHLLKFPAFLKKEKRFAVESGKGVWKTDNRRTTNRLS
jgi:hypothetical protein